MPRKPRVAPQEQEWTIHVVNGESRTQFPDEATARAEVRRLQAEGHKCVHIETPVDLSGIPNERLERFDADLRAHAVRFNLDPRWIGKRFDVGRKQPWMLVGLDLANTQPCVLRCLSNGAVVVATPGAVRAAIAHHETDKRSVQ